ncbi:DUF3891 family protein [Salinibacillus xinjiangensis]|uniref:DUF3891 family protein n=1 Tax=Salinibacillus xinjiangensis TaxID=1229268 RepID=A0A6G1XAG1_9BACI|nr:DUF3891 family protein [Salinibacillus xinjiangensis]MRG87927.1 DUF3891 family protein [Salinibacillus xinjiangensis]
MIVVEGKNDFCMIEQHEHGKISGAIANHLKAGNFLGKKLRTEVEFAITNHDYAWFDIDKKPLWNKETGKPYSFMDYPLEDKVKSYQKGINDIQQTSVYAAYLCSKHYTFFFSADSTDIYTKSFISQEIDRRNEIASRNQAVQDAHTVDFHFKLLQFCDDLSLYLCMNKPGATKEEEIAWFRDGFRQKFNFAEDGMHAHWENEYVVVVSPFPFTTSFEVDIPYKRLSKDKVMGKGLEKAYKETKQELLNIQIQPK